MLIGDNKKFVCALIVPCFMELKKWFADHNLVYTNNAEAVKNNKVQELFQNIIDGFNPNFNHVEQIKKFVLLPSEWSLETGEMTPKMSLKRKVILEKFSKEIDTIYS